MSTYKARRHRQLWTMKSPRYRPVGMSRRNWPAWWKAQFSGNIRLNGLSIIRKRRYQKFWRDEMRKVFEQLFPAKLSGTVNNGTPEDGKEGVGQE